jgi:hypothetical protein
VDVTVDQPWRDRAVWNIDVLGVGRRVDAWADSADEVAFEKNSTRTLWRRTGAIDERVSRDEDGARVVQGEREV